MESFEFTTHELSIFIELAKNANPDDYASDEVKAAIIKARAYYNYPGRRWAVRGNAF